MKTILVKFGLKARTVSEMERKTSLYASQVPFVMNFITVYHSKVEILIGQQISSVGILSSISWLILSANYFN